jgi:hypothetical protein
MNQLEGNQFLELYQKFRYEDQINYYRGRQREFSGAQTQAITISILLILLAAIAGALEAVDVSWVKITCQIIATIAPVLSTALAAYNALYAFEQQAKLYQDTLHNLSRARILIPPSKPGLSDQEYADQLRKFVHEVEETFRAEQGQWGQLARNMKPLET